MIAALTVPLRPAMALMRTLRLPQKLSLLAVVLAAPLVLLLVLLVARLQSVTADAQAERDGAQVTAALLSVAHRIQDLRGLTARAMNQDTAAVPLRDAARTALKTTWAEAESTAAAVTQFALPARWGDLRTAVVDLVEGRVAPQRDAAFQQHVEAIRQLRSTLADVSHASRLSLDPEPETSLLIDLATERTIALGEAVALVRGQGAAVLARGEAGTRDRMTLLGNTERIDLALGELDHRFGLLQASGGASLAAWPAARDAARTFAEQARKMFLADVIDGQPEPYFREASAVLAAVASVEREVLETLQARLQSRTEQAQMLLWGVGGGAVLGLVLMTVLSLGFYLSFQGSLSALHHGVDRTAAGDLSHTLEVPGRDEMAEIAQLVNGMNQRLSAMVAQIRSNAVRVSMAGRVVADGSAALSDRTAEQAASLRQTLGSTRALSQAVADNASAAAQLDQLTGRLRQQAETGGQAMRETVDAMAQLEEGSRKVAEIIAVIDSIAFQTNILALNAAVEAARAGESGRGFAVVAAEVRQLAQRSAGAAGEIRQLIGQSRDQVGVSVERIRHVGGVLEGLVSGVREASDSLRGIANASASQSAELQEVTSSVGSLDGITQQNAQMVEQASAASSDLVERAAALKLSVATLKLRQGSADEAVALVERALPLLHSKGLQGASAALHSAEEGFVDRDLYVFVVDRQGTYRLHGAKPAMEGKRVHDVPGIDGPRFVNDVFAAAQAGGGWVEYDILNADTGAVLPKASYVMALDEQMAVGCGVYRHDTAAPATAPTPARDTAPVAAQRPVAPARTKAPRARPRAVETA
jgi:methyl-accepting chemotaxis protein